MAIITISRGSYSKGRDVAQRVAERLGYRCIAREVILDASKEFNIPEIRLVRAVHDAPSILERFTHGKEKYIAYFRSALLKQLKSNNAVYHGLAGHYFLRGVPHVLKVRIIADLEDRIKIVMERDNAAREAAVRILKSDDEERRKWGLSLYGIDTSDPSLYDLVIHIGNISVEGASELICKVAGSSKYETTPEAQKVIDDLALAAEVRAALMEIRAVSDVEADGGLVTVITKMPVEEEKDLVDEIHKAAKSVQGVKNMEIKVATRVKWIDGRLFP